MQSVGFGMNLIYIYMKISTLDHNRNEYLSIKQVVVKMSRVLATFDIFSTFSPSQLGDYGNHSRVFSEVDVDWVFSSESNFGSLKVRIIRLGDVASFSKPIKDLLKVFYTPHFLYPFRGSYSAGSPDTTIFSSKFTVLLLSPIPALGPVKPPPLLLCTLPPLVDPVVSCNG